MPRGVPGASVPGTLRAHAFPRAGALRRAPGAAVCPCAPAYKGRARGTVAGWKRAPLVPRASGASRSWRCLRGGGVRGVPLPRGRPHRRAVGGTRGSSSGSPRSTSAGAIASRHSRRRRPTGAPYSTAELVAALQEWRRSEVAQPLVCIGCGHVIEPDELVTCIHRSGVSTWHETCRLVVRARRAVSRGRVRKFRSRARPGTGRAASLSPGVPPPK